MNMASNGLRIVRKESACHDRRIMSSTIEVPQNDLNEPIQLAKFLGGGQIWNT